MKVKGFLGGTWSLDIIPTLLFLFWDDNQEYMTGVIGNISEMCHLGGGFTVLEEF